MEDKKNVIITGARKGIGRATVEKFASEGANVWACARKEDESFEADMEQLSVRYSVSIKPVYFDMNDEAALKEAVKGIIKEKRSIDCLVHIAGIAAYEKLQFMRLEEARKLYENNYFSALQLTQLLMRRLTKNTGSIVFVSSIAAYKPEIGNLAYGGSKAAISQATKVLAQELAPDGIRVNAVAPGVVETEMKLLAAEESWNRLIQSTLFKRCAKPEEIANVIYFLSSDQASYMSGQIIHIDGGIL